MTDYMGWRFCQFENAEARKVDVDKIVDDFASERHDGGEDYDVNRDYRMCSSNTN